ncbi:hypothetical protein HK102_007570 [Quaeritorhiza haematococci]|nr:hypothetical protein HK102_007570 [Quaeritorhiza haematococci]
MVNPDRRSIGTQTDPVPCFAFSTAPKNIINVDENNIINDENNDEDNDGQNTPAETQLPLSKSCPTERLISHIQRQLHNKGLDAHPRAFTDYLQQMWSLRDNGELLI